MSPQRVPNNPAPLSQEHPARLPAWPRPLLSPPSHPFSARRPLPKAGGAHLCQTQHVATPQRKGDQEMGPRTEREKGSKQIWRVNWPAPRTVQSAPLHSLISRSSGILQLRTNAKPAAEPEKGGGRFGVGCGGGRRFPP